MSQPGGAVARRARKAWAFLKRDYLIATSYKVAFAMQLGSVLIWVPICYFIGEGVSVEGSQRFHQGLPHDRVAGSAIRTYPDLRHEIFNEPEREDVLADVLRWIRARVGP